MKDFFQEFGEFSGDSFEDSGEWDEENLEQGVFESEF